MTSLSFVQCGVTLILYERMRIDWVGVGVLARLDHLSNPAWWERIIIWASQRGSILIFLALCVFQDAFITTVYFRRAKFDGLYARDWRIFFASVLVSNFYWTLRSGAVALVLAGAWYWITQP